MRPLSTLVWVEREAASSSTDLSSGSRETRYPRGSSIVSVAIVQLFIQNKTSYIAHENITRLQENGRYAIQLLTRALRSADYWGCIPSFQGNPSPKIQPVAIDVVDVGTGIAPAITSGVFGAEGAVAAGPAGYTSLPEAAPFSLLHPSQQQMKI